MPKLIRLYIKHSLIGFAISGVFVVLLVYFNIANMGHLLWSSDRSFLPVAMLFVANGIVFSAVQFGIAVMGLADSGDSGDNGKKHPVLPRGALMETADQKSLVKGSRSLPFR